MVFPVSLFPFPVFPINTILKKPESDDAASPEMRNYRLLTINNTFASSTTQINKYTNNALQLNIKFNFMHVHLFVIVLNSTK